MYTVVQGEESLLRQVLGRHPLDRIMVQASSSKMMYEKKYFRRAQLQRARNNRAAALNRRRALEAVGLSDAELTAAMADAGPSRTRPALQVAQFT